jgi:hypothetical protein
VTAAFIGTLLALIVYNAFFKGSNKDDGGCCSGCGCVILLLILAAMF